MDGGCLPIPGIRRIARGCVTISDKNYPIYDGLNLVGRNPRAGINIKHVNVSHYHAIITVVDENHLYLGDLGSSNGTFLNGQRLKSLDIHTLDDGASIKFGDVIGDYKRIFRENGDSCDLEMTQNVTQNFYTNNTQLINSVGLHEMATQLAIANEPDFHELSTQSVEDLHNLPTQLLHFNPPTKSVEDLHNLPTQVLHFNPSTSNNDDDSDSDDSMDFLTMPMVLESKNTNSVDSDEGKSSQIHCVKSKRKNPLDSDSEGSSGASHSGPKPSLDDDNLSNNNGASTSSNHNVIETNSKSSQNTDTGNSSQPIGFRQRKSIYVLSDDETDIEDNDATFNDSDLIPATQNRSTDGLTANQSSFQDSFKLELSADPVKDEVKEAKGESSLRHSPDHSYAIIDETKIEDNSLMEGEERNVEERLSDHDYAIKSDEDGSLEGIEDVVRRDLMEDMRELVGNENKVVEKTEEIDQNSVAANVGNLENSLDRSASEDTIEYKEDATKEAENTEVGIGGKENGNVDDKARSMDEREDNEEIGGSTSVDNAENLKRPVEKVGTTETCINDVSAQVDSTFANSSTEDPNSLKRKRKSVRFSKGTKNDPSESTQPLDLNLERSKENREAEDDFYIQPTQRLETSGSIPEGLEYRSTFYEDPSESDLYLLPTQPVTTTEEEPEGIADKVEDQTLSPKSTSPAEIQNGEPSSKAIVTVEDQSNQASLMVEELTGEVEDQVTPTLTAKSISQTEDKIDDQTNEEVSKTFQTEAAESEDFFQNSEPGDDSSVVVEDVFLQPAMAAKRKVVVESVKPGTSKQSQDLEEQLQEIFASQREKFSETQLVDLLEDNLTRDEDKTDDVEHHTMQDMINESIDDLFDDHSEQRKNDKSNVESSIDSGKGKRVRKRSVKLQESSSDENSTKAKKNLKVEETRKSGRKRKMEDTPAASTSTKSGDSEETGAAKEVITKKKLKVETEDSSDSGSTRSKRKLEAVKPTEKKKDEDNVETVRGGRRRGVKKTSVSDDDGKENSMVKDAMCEVAPGRKSTRSLDKRNKAGPSKEKKLDENPSGRGKRTKQKELPEEILVDRGKHEDQPTRTSLRNRSKLEKVEAAIEDVFHRPRSPKTSQESDELEEQMQELFASQREPFSSTQLVNLLEEDLPRNECETGRSMQNLINESIDNLFDDDVVTNEINGSRSGNSRSKTKKSKIDDAPVPGSSEDSQKLETVPENEKKVALKNEDHSKDRRRGLRKISCSVVDEAKDNQAELVTESKSKKRSNDTSDKQAKGIEAGSSKEGEVEENPRGRGKRKIEKLPDHKLELPVSAKLKKRLTEAFVADLAPSPDGSLEAVRVAAQAANTSKQAATKTRKTRVTPSYIEEIKVTVPKKPVVASSSKSTTVEAPTRKSSRQSRATTSKLCTTLPPVMEPDAISISSTSSVASDKSRGRRLSANSRSMRVQQTENVTPAKRSRREKTPSSDDEFVVSKNSLHNLSVVGSPSERNRRKLKPKVVFTMMDDPGLESAIRQLGGSVVDAVDACTVLVTSAVKRTCKLLTAVGQGKPICSTKWVLDSKKAFHFLDPWDYIITDEEAEEKWQFSLRASLEKSTATKLMEGYTFQLMVTAGVDVLKGAIEACGGKCVNRATDCHNFVIVAAAQNKNKYAKILKQRPEVKVVEPEAIFDGTLRQELRFDRHLLS